MTRSDVLIIGAGPTGLVLALWLTKLGATVRIIDKTAEPGGTSRALAVHARTLELYSQLDLANAVTEKGHKVPGRRSLGPGQKRSARVFRACGGRCHALPIPAHLPPG
jgi:2-polyprenyl-6-methoxyphenol hydroxylase-like FAD-dependent oxidoreductase